VGAPDSINRGALRSARLRAHRDAALGHEHGPFEDVQSASGAQALPSPSATSISRHRRASSGGHIDGDGALAARTTDPRLIAALAR
jgi:hypothetical protein